MRTLYTINSVDADRLSQVIDIMTHKGSPEIRVVDCGDYYVAIEGTHRIAASCKLGIPIDMVILGQDETVNGDTLDIDYFDEDESYPAGEIASEIYNADATIYWVDDDGNLEVQ